MKRFVLPLYFLFTCAISLQAQEFTMSGTVIDQDGSPVVGAQVSFYSQTVISMTTDENGFWQVSVPEIIRQKVSFVVEAKGYPSYRLLDTPLLNGRLSTLNVILYNAITYKAGERSTIFFPESTAPDPSWGKYYRLVHVEGNRLIFERDRIPLGGFPYVFFPNEDLRIDISQMTFGDNGRYEKVDGKVGLVGSFDVSEETEFLGTEVICIPDESISFRENPLPLYTHPMHAFLYWFTTEFPYQAGEVEFEYRESSRLVTGTVCDQDGNPIAGAQVTLANGTYYQTSTTDADGHYQIEVEDKEKEYGVSAYAYGHTSITEGPIICPAENDVCDLVLYNALNYTAGKRYTIVLPIAPEASAGRYFRLDRVEGGNIIFEREYSPQADVPYVFYPNKDFRIDLREMDLSKEAGTTTITVAHDGVGSRDAACFMGSYSYMRSSILEVDTPVYFDDDDQGDNSAGLYHIDAMHATLLWNWHAFDRPFQPSYEAPSFVFHDPEEDISPYRPFVEDGKVWKVGLLGDAPGWFDKAGRLDFYFFDGDTIIDGRDCKKMMRKTQYSHEDRTATYVGALYEENRCVYCALPNRTDFVLLYDFVATPGTELTYYSTDANEITKGFIKERSRTENEKYHGVTTIVLPSFRNIYVDYDTINLIWREGVGYNGFNNGHNFEVEGGFTALMSCTIGDEVLYFDPEIIDCVTPEDTEVKKNTIDFTHIVKTQPKAPRSLTPSPSPAGEGSEGSELTGEYSLKELFVNFKPLAGPYVITICNNSGTEVYRKEVQTNNVIGLNTDISSYPKGEYTITVENDAEAYMASIKIDDAVGINRPTPDPIPEQSSPTRSLSRDGGENAGAVWDLSGRQIIARPSGTLDPSRNGKLNKGIYIKDGKKVVVR